jgi:TIR domain/NB-ARC domain
MAASSARPIEAFISYSHKDDEWRAKLEAHLDLLKRDGVIDLWHDRRIDAGREWADGIHVNLDRAAVILLLVSSDFIASDYCYEREMKRALERHDAGDACVIPVIVRSVDWQGAPFAKLQALPRDGKAVKSWEDEDEAFTDVAKGIRRVIEELWSRRRPGLPTIWNVPYLRNPNFTGRDTLLDELHKKLRDGRVALTAVHGMGGVGKTQLALEYAYRHAGEFDLVWWLRAEEPASLLEDYAALAGPLGIAKAGEGELAALANAVCQALTRRDRWLLVLDNATGPDDLTSLLPKTGGGRVLITSRNPSWPRALPLAVPVLEHNAAIAFLLDQTGEQDREAADAVATELGDLPLALDEAAAYVTETGLGLAPATSIFFVPVDGSCGPRRSPLTSIPRRSARPWRPTGCARGSRWPSIC